MISRNLIAETKQTRGSVSSRGWMATVLPFRQDRFKRDKPKIAANHASASLTTMRLEMPFQLVRMRVALAVMGVVLTLQPAAARHPVHYHGHADGVIRSWGATPRPPVHYDDTPRYNDPSKNGCCG